MIPQETSDAIENTRDKILMWQPNIKVDKRVLRNLYDASVEEKTVNILYETTEDEIYREIEPMGLYVYDGYWYCPAYCRMRRGIRLFRVDRIKKQLLILLLIPLMSIRMLKNGCILSVNLIS